MIVAGISIISELIMTLGVLYCTSMIDDVKQQVKNKSLVVSLVFIALVSVCFNVVFCFQNTAARLIFLIINYFKFVMVAIIAYRKFSIKIVCLTFILNSICNICKVGISFLIPMEQTFATYTSELTLLTIRIIVLILVVIFKKHSERNYSGNILGILPNHIYIIVLVNIFLADGLIETANFKTTNVTEKEAIIKVIAVFLTICIIAALISLLLSVVSKKYYSDINSMLEGQIQAQISYYEAREKNYTEIRKFKHDYINHINCVRSLLQAGRYDDVSEYLESLSDIFPMEYTLFNTGNFVSDVILSDKQNSVIGKNITIKFDGSIPASINKTDLCIILGNAIDNAVEACRGLEGEKDILVYGGFSHGYFVLTVKNPTDNVASGNDILPFTTKSNKFEHGFGLLNIKSVVDKYDGYMKIENADNFFTLSLTFNSVISECVNS